MAATRQSLMEFGRALMFGTSGLDPSPPATINPPAGGRVVTLGSDTDAAKWQSDAWRLWGKVGELHYPSCRLSRQASQVEWRVRINGRELSPDSAKAEIETVTAGLGADGATYLLSLNDIVAGEGWYVQVSDDPLKFEVWSVVEDDLDKKIKKIKDAGRIAVKIHQPDPRNPSKADSSVRTAIEPAEELLTLRSLSRSQARSRMSQAGVLITPAEQVYAEADPWEQNLLEAMSSAIKNVDSPSALVPIHVRMRRDLIEFVRYVTFPRPYDDLIDRKIERAIISVANAQDIEPELIQGIGDSTYWNAWAVSMDTYQAHIAPRVERIGALYAVVSQMLRQSAGQTNVVVEITPDPRVMLARRSSVRDAFDGLKMGVVGFAYVREAMGATEADAPTEEEWQRILELNGSGRTMDRERRVGENPGPARSSPENSSVLASDCDVASHARKTLGFALRDAWRHTPHRNRLSGIEPSEFTCHIPLSEINAEFDLQGGVAAVIRAAVMEKAAAGDVDRLTSWIVKTLDMPTQAVCEIGEVA